MVRVPGEKARQIDRAVVESFEVSTHELKKVEHRIELMGFDLVFTLLQDVGVLP